MAQLSIQNLSKSYGKTTALDDFSLDVGQGELMVLLGPSGSGKTTLLRLLAGLDVPDTGTVQLGGRELLDQKPQMRNVAMVFQDYALYPHMTVEANIAFPLKARKLDRADINDRVQRIAETLKLEDLLRRKPSELSGGQQQRVAMGRAIVRESDLLLMDEPLSGADERLRDAIRNQMRSLHEEFGLTTIFVTHNQADALMLGHRVAVIEAGRVVQSGSPMEIYDQPRSRFAAEFVGCPSINFLSPEDLGLKRQGVEVAIRPERILLEKPSTPHIVCSGSIRSKQFVGSHWIYGIAIGNSRLLANVGRDYQLQQGDGVTVYVCECDLQQFDAHTGSRC